MNLRVARAEDPGFASRSLHGDFSGSSHTSDLKIGTPVATLPGVIGSVLGLVCPTSATVSELESLICSFYLSVAARLSRSVP